MAVETMARKMPGRDRSTLWVSSATQDRINGLKGADQKGYEDTQDEVIRGLIAFYKSHGGGGKRSWREFLADRGKKT